MSALLQASSSCFLLDNLSDLQISLSFSHGALPSLPNQRNIWLVYDDEKGDSGNGLPHSLRPLRQDQAFVSWELSQPSRFAHQLSARLLLALPLGQLSASRINQVLPCVRRRRAIHRLESQPQEHRSPTPIGGYVHWHHGHQPAQCAPVMDTAPSSREATLAFRSVKYDVLATLGVS